MGAGRAAWRLAVLLAATACLAPVVTAAAAAAPAHANGTSASGGRRLLGSWLDSPRANRFAQAKRGICWRFKDEKGKRPLRPFTRVSWAMNWGLQPEESVGDSYSQQGIEFVPMMWSRWGIDSLPSRIPPNSWRLLGFNEPNRRSQANLSPQEAASYWPRLEAVARDQRLALGSPAVTPCSGPDCTMQPWAWMDEFFRLCQGCKVDFVAVHYYACNFDWLRWFLLEAHSKYGRPVWLTEFSCPGQAASVASDFFRQFADWADAQPWLERYSWFALSVSGTWIGGGSDLMNYKSLKLTKLGRLYNKYTAGGGHKRIHAASVRDGGQGSHAWSELCGRCAELPQNATAEEQRYCRWSCGAWQEGELERSGPGSPY